MSHDREAIITTVQKFQALISACSPDKNSTEEGSDGENFPAGRHFRFSEKERDAVCRRCHELCIAFVVDECHRTVTYATKKLIDSFIGSTARPVSVRLYRNADIHREQKDREGRLSGYNRKALRQGAPQIHYKGGDQGSVSPRLQAAQGLCCRQGAGGSRKEIRDTS